MRLASMLLIFCLLPAPGKADDGAASIAAGGLVLMKRESRITMAKEVLRISPRKVVVDYDFRNDSNDDIDTVVAFPIAPYTWDDYYWSHENALNQLDSHRSESRISSFRLYVDGKPERYHTEAKALLNGHDYAALLRSMKIDPATFGHIPEEPARDDFDSLAPLQRTRLIQLGLLKKGDGPLPLWKVEVRYYWTQHFPAHQLVHIRHEYVPIAGETQIPPDLLPGRKIDAVEEESAKATRQTVAKTCIPPAAIDRIRRTLDARPLLDTRNMNVEASTREWFKHLVLMDWVDFILTTANTWKQPIEDFTLIVESRPYPHQPPVSVYFCGDGPLSPGMGSTTVFHARNFVPTKELTVGFYRY